jgi:hypothetical protein
LNKLKGTWEILSLDGKLMVSNQISEMHKVINAEAWSDGIYLYNFKTKKGNVSVKFVKNK